MLARIRKSMEEKDQGFTLIELLVVMIIIGILAAIAIPVFLNQRKKGWDSAVKSDLKNAATSEETILTEAGAYAASAPDTNWPGWKQSDLTNYDATTNTITVKAYKTDYVGTTAPTASTNGATYNTGTSLWAGSSTTGGTTTTADTTVGYCLSAKSASGVTWVYNSLKGGLQPAGSTCP